MADNSDMWIVYRPQPAVAVGSPPKFYKTEQGAIGEAERLARKFPNEKIYIYQAVTAVVVKTSEPIEESLV
jgi:hypothetical protein